MILYIRVEATFATSSASGMSLLCSPLALLLIIISREKLRYRKKHESVQALVTGAA